MQLYYAKLPFVYCGVTIPANAIIVKMANGDLYLCKTFPRNYRGKNPELKILCYDAQFQAWLEPEIKRDKMTREMWAYYVRGGCKRMRYECNYSALMKHDRKHKRSAGQKEYIETLTDYECSNNPLHDFRKYY